MTQATRIRLLNFRSTHALEKTLKILVTEDDALIGMSVEDALVEAGFATHLVNCGEEAIAALAGVENGYIALITDIQLGDGPSGWDVARHARETDPSFPIVYVSGDSAHEHGILGVPESVMLQKPFVAAQIVTAVTMLLNTRPTI